MVFIKQDSVTRNPHIKDLVITLYRGPIVPHQSIEFSLTIDDQFDSPMGTISGNLVPHLTAGQITALQSFMDAMWAKAESEVIG